MFVNQMDFLRYNIKLFEENDLINFQDPIYTKLKENIDDIKKNYNCFRTDFVPVNFHTNTWSKNDLHKKTCHKYIKPKSFLKCHLNHDNIVSFTVSNLNKLTMENYEKVFTNFGTKIDEQNLIKTVDLILQTNDKAVLCNELYVGLVFHLYTLGNSNVKRSIWEKCNSYIQELFNKDLYETNDENETYDMFCLRLKNKNEITSRIRAFFFIIQHESFNNLKYTFSDLIVFMFDFLEEVVNKKEFVLFSEQLLDSLIVCFDLKENIKIPSVHKKFLSKNKICFQKLKSFSEICERIINVDSFCSFKIKFKIQDLENRIQNY